MQSLDELEELRIRLAELAGSVSHRLDNLEADPARLDLIEERLAILERLCRKHGGDTAAVLARRAEMEAELAEHLERETEELIARGVPRAEARRQASATMGRMDAIKEECRDARGTAVWEQLRQDVSFGVRLLVKNRTFSSMALATMRSRESGAPERIR